MVTATNNASSTENASKNNFANFKIPQIDMQAVMNSYKKNLEVLAMANKMSVEVCTGIFKLQTALFQQMTADMSDLMQFRKPDLAMAKFSEVTRDNIVKIINNSNQISSMITAANNDLTAAVATRLRDSISEAKEAMNKASN